MLNWLRALAERWLLIPPDPTPPPGDEASMRIFRAAPNFYKYLLCIWGIRSAALLFAVVVPVGIPIVASAVVLWKQGNQWALLLLLIPAAALVIVLFIILFHLGVLQLDFEKRWYVVTDRSLRIREGVVSVREMTVNFANIQNISISQGPIQRALQIADLRVDTAGGGGGGDRREAGQNLHTAWFRGIDNANEVRELMQRRLGQLKDSGLGDHDDLAPRAGNAIPESFVAALREVQTEARKLRHAVAAPGKEA
jgi:membrane protein YdbS with pleckstrin-like domain